MKLLTALQALILIGLTVYGAGAAADKPLQSLSCTPVERVCLNGDAARP